MSLPQLSVPVLRNGQRLRVAHIARGWELPAPPRSLRNEGYTRTQCTIGWRPRP